jgi:murein DD-endopeptidase MepM/ murein hydrolase activator NlpD
VRSVPPLVAAVLALALPAHVAAASAGTAAVQAVLRARGVYAGDVDGVSGPATAAAVRAFQRRHRLSVDGVAGPGTRRAFGRVGRHRYGTRAMQTGDVGFDVAMLQFELEVHGFPNGRVDGGYGSHVAAAVTRFQRWAGLGADGVAGPGTLRALRAPPPRSPFAFGRPVAAPVGDPFGPRGSGFHPGIDFPSPSGTPVVAARAGRVVHAGWSADGYGNQVVLAHGGGVRTRYAHLSSVAVSHGQWVGAGARVGRVGATGFATGPHLHFEVLVRGAAVAPLL